MLTKFMDLEEIKRQIAIEKAKKEVEEDFVKRNKERIDLKKELKELKSRNSWKKKVMGSIKKGVGFLQKGLDKVKKYDVPNKKPPGIDYKAYDKQMNESLW